MVSCAVLILGHLWIQSLAQSCTVEELPRAAVLSWFKERVLEGLGLEEPPMVQGPEGPRHTRVPRSSRAAWEHHQTQNQDSTEIILFPTSDSFGAESETGKSTNSCFTCHFQPSISLRHFIITSAQLWFFSGEGVNSSSPLLILITSEPQHFLTPTESSSDGWSTYALDPSSLTSVADGPFLFWICCWRLCRSNQPDQTPFLHIHIKPRGLVRFPRNTAPTIPWSPSAVYLLQRPSEERPQQDDCRREEIQISFEELGWDNWVVHPKALTFYYCHGNCSAQDRTAAALGISQCCTPVPGTMRSLRITTTSDGGYSFKHETLPNIMPEECNCI